MHGNKAITRAVLAVSLLGGVLLGATATGPAWGDVSRLAHLSVNPSSGPAGSAVLLRGKGFAPKMQVTITFTDGTRYRVLLWIRANSRGSFRAAVCIPPDAIPRTDTISAASPGNSSMGETTFYVIPGAAALSHRAGSNAPENICV